MHRLSVQETSKNHIIGISRTESWLDNKSNKQVVTWVSKLQQWFCCNIYFYCGTYPSYLFICAVFKSCCSTHATTASSHSKPQHRRTYQRLLQAVSIHMPIWGWCGNNNRSARFSGRTTVTCVKLPQLKCQLPYLQHHGNMPSTQLLFFFGVAFLLLCIFPPATWQCNSCKLAPARLFTTLPRF